MENKGQKARKAEPLSAQPSNSTAELGGPAAPIALSPAPARKARGWLRRCVKRGLYQAATLKARHSGTQPSVS
eukprot:3967363-Pyramimonas_sp.AAC.1